MASPLILLSLGLLSHSLQIMAQPAPAVQECACPTDSIPVCANGTMYINPCMAACKGFPPPVTYPVVDGKCDKLCPTCPLDFMPVCANGTLYSNACTAQCNGFLPNQTYTAEAGTCEFIPVPGCVPPVLTNTTAKACAISSDREVFQFNSHGEAACFGLPDTFPCNDMSKCAACMPYQMDVCAKSPLSPKGIPFANPCFATCAGYTNVTLGSCSCGCSKEYAPVCAISAPEGKMDQYPNACMAACAGVLQWTQGPCSVAVETCVCPTDYIPVCATSATGSKATFPNACNAACGHSVSTVPGVCEVGGV